MRKYKYGLVIILSFLLCPITMKAAICSNSEMVYLQDLAKNILYSYDYVEEGNTAYFNIYFNNMSDGLYLENMDTNQIYNNSNNGEMVLGRVEQGKQYRFNVYSNNLCKNVIIRSIYVNLPYYNPYYNDEICKGIENYKFCQKFVNKQFDYSEFEENVLRYKNQHKQDEINEDKNKNNIFDSILNIYLKSYYIVLPIIIVIAFFIKRRYEKKEELF